MGNGLFLIALGLIVGFMVLSGRTQAVLLALFYPWNVSEKSAFGAEGIDISPANPASERGGTDTLSGDFLSNVG